MARQPRLSVNSSCTSCPPCESEFLLHSGSTETQGHASQRRCAASRCGRGIWLRSIADQRQINSARGRMLEGLLPGDYLLVADKARRLGRALVPGSLRLSESSLAPPPGPNNDFTNQRGPTSMKAGTMPATRSPRRWTPLQQSPARLLACSVRRRHNYLLLYSLLFCQGAAHQSPAHLLCRRPRIATATRRASRCATRALALFDRGSTADE